MRPPSASQQIFPRSLTVGAQVRRHVVVQEPEASDDRKAAASGGRDVSLGCRLLAMAATPIKWCMRRRRRKMSSGAISRSMRLLLDPETNEVLDFVGGRDDLRAGIIRAIGRPEERFREDKLRMIRAVRFAARFRLRDRAGNVRARFRSSRRKFDQVSAERLRDELTKLLTEGAARRGFRAAGRNAFASRVLARNCADEGRGAAAAISSRRRRVDSHAADAGRLDGGMLADSGLGRAAARCGQAANVHAAAGPNGGFVSIDTWKSARDGRGDLPHACDFRTTIRSRSRRWWRTTCGSRMCRR